MEIAPLTQDSHANELLAELKCAAKGIRLEVLEMIHRVGSGHPGGSLSAADILAVLYFHHLRLDSKRPDWPDRDRFVASKGHCAPALYAALAAAGFIRESELAGFRQLGGSLQGHPDMTKTPGVDISTGSLGHGLSVGIGMALGGRLSGRGFRTYVLIGDGECNEGQNWEAAMAAAKYDLDSLTGICDCNGVQLDGTVEDIMPMGALGDKWRAFGWDVLEANGHDVGEIADVLDAAASVRGRPTMILAHTVKGKGVSYMEGRFEWHGRAPDDEQYRQAVDEVSADGC